MSAAGWAFPARATAARPRSAARPRPGGPGGSSERSEARDEQSPKWTERLQEPSSAANERAAADGGPPRCIENCRVDLDAHRRQPFRLVVDRSPCGFELLVEGVAGLPPDRLQLFGYRVAR